MRKLLKLTPALAICSLLPIMCHTFLGILFGELYTNGMMVAYPYQFAYGLIYNIFCFGFFKKDILDNDKQFSRAKIAMYIALGISLVMCAISHVYSVNILNSLQIDLKYKDIFIYTVYSMCNDWVIFGIVRLQQFMEKDKMANNICISYFTLKLVIMIISKILFNDIAINLTFINLIMTFVSLILLIKFCGLKIVKISIADGFRYSLSDTPYSILMLIIYIFGLRELGTELEAYNVNTLCTDTQWDLEAEVSDTFGSLESKDKHGYLKNNKNKRDLLYYALLMNISSVIMAIMYWRIFDFKDIKLTFIFMAIEMVALPVSIINNYYIAYIQIWHPTIALFISSLLSYVARFVAQMIIGGGMGVAIGCFVGIIVHFIITIVILKSYENSTNKQQSIVNIN